MKPWFKGFMLFLFVSTHPLWGEDEHSTPAPITDADVREAFEQTEAIQSSQVTELRIRVRGGRQYVVPMSRLTTNEGATFQALSESERTHFQRNRAIILRFAAGLMDILRTPIGLWRGPISNFFRRQRNSTPVRELGMQTVQSVIENLDRELWKNAPVLSRANEMGGSLEVGFSGGAIAHRGFFGIMGLGLTVSYDGTNHIAVLELFQDIESARHAVPFYAGFGAFATITGTVTEHDWRNPLAVERGRAFCLPGLVGCMTPNILRIGVSREVGIGFPGVAAITSNAFRVPLARVGFSPKWLGGFRAQILGGHAITSVPRVVVNTLRSSCGALLSLFSRR